jgi:hypothetical protein
MALRDKPDTVAAIELDQPTMASRQTSKNDSPWQRIVKVDRKWFWFNSLIKTCG